MHFLNLKRYCELYQKVEFDSSLNLLTADDVVYLLPWLHRRMESSPSMEEDKSARSVLRTFVNRRHVNAFSLLLQTDFSLIAKDLKSQILLWNKEPDNPKPVSNFLTSLTDGVLLEFERSSTYRRFLLVLSELLLVLYKVQRLNVQSEEHESELFGESPYFDEISYIISIACTELGEIFPLPEVIEACMYLTNGNDLACRLVIQHSGRLAEVCKHIIISSAEKQHQTGKGGGRAEKQQHKASIEDIKRRIELLRLFGEMDNSLFLRLHYFCLDTCQCPTITFALLMCYLNKAKSLSVEDGCMKIVTSLTALLFGSPFNAAPASTVTNTGTPGIGTASHRGLTAAPFLSTNSPGRGGPGPTASVAANFLSPVVATAPSPSGAAYLFGPGLNDSPQQRSDRTDWFLHFVRNTQKHQTEPEHSTLTALRQCLLNYLEILIKLISGGGGGGPRSTKPGGAGCIRQQTLLLAATGLFRIYAGLRGLANLKLTDDESRALVNLAVVSRVRVDEETDNEQEALSMDDVVDDDRFKSLAICTILMCGSVISVSNEAKVVNWITRLIDADKVRMAERSRQASPHTHLQQPSSTATTTAGPSNGGSNGASPHSRSSGRGNNFSELLLLIAIHFHTNNLNGLLDIATSILGVKNCIKQGSVVKLRHIFTEKLFSEQTLASYAALISPTENLTAYMTSAAFLPVSCINLLIKNRSFARCNIPIQDWVLDQIICCGSPLHEVSVVMIDNFLQSVLVLTNRLTALSQPIDEEAIRSLLVPSPHRTAHTKLQQQHSYGGESLIKIEVDGEGNESDNQLRQHQKGLPSCPLSPLPHVSEACQILLVYYLLAYHDLLLKQLKSLVNLKKAALPSSSSVLPSISMFQQKLSPRRQGQTIQQPFFYSSRLMSQIPLKQVLLTVDQFPQSYHVIAGPLHRLAIEHYPHLCCVDNELNRTFNEIYTTVVPSTLSTSLSTSSCALSEQDINSVLHNASEDSLGAIDLLSRLTTFDYFHLKRYSEVVARNIYHVVGMGRRNRRLTDLYKDLWFKIDCVATNSFLTETIHHLRLQQLHHNTITDTTGPISLTRSAGQPYCKPYSNDDLTRDPLIILASNHLVFQNAPILEILLRILSIYMTASRKTIIRNLQIKVAMSSGDGGSSGAAGMSDGPVVVNGPGGADLAAAADEDMKNTLLACQESAIIQILLETCLELRKRRRQSTCSGGGGSKERKVDRKIKIEGESSKKRIKSNESVSDGERERTEDDAVRGDGDGTDEDDTIGVGGEGVGLEGALVREIECLICSFIHQMFVSDKDRLLAKLVHFQGYPHELLELTVQGIPSMHVCLDFIPELMASPYYDKQIFAMDLLSYLCLQYPIPSALGSAKLAIDTIDKMHSVLPVDSLWRYHGSLLGALIRFSRAFPPLSDDICKLLLQLFASTTFHLNLNNKQLFHIYASDNPAVTPGGAKKRKLIEDTDDSVVVPNADSFPTMVKRTLRTIVGGELVTSGLYSS